MEYICHRKYQGMSEAGKEVKISRGQKFPVIGVRIAKDNASVCVTTSEVSHKHFAINDDGKGLERGALTYAIAYKPRSKKHSDGHVFRFLEDEIKNLRENWKHFLRPDDAVILFNHDFFTADVDELKKMAAEFGIKA